CSMGWRQRRRVRAACQGRSLPELSQLRPIETATVLGPTSRRSPLWKNRRFARAEVGSPRQKVFTEGNEGNEDSVYGLFATTRGARLPISIWALTFWRPDASASICLSCSASLD